MERNSLDGQGEGLEERGPGGRFVPGNRGGPGRPPKVPRKGRGDVLAEDDLRAMVNAADGASLWFVAKGFEDRDLWLEWIRESFAPEVVERVERVVKIAEAAEKVLLGRLLRELGGER